MRSIKPPDVPANVVRRILDLELKLKLQHLVIIGTIVPQEYIRLKMMLESPDKENFTVAKEIIDAYN
jgi:hypothetical protein